MNPSIEYSGIFTVQPVRRRIFVVDFYWFGGWPVCSNQ